MHRFVRPAVMALLSLGLAVGVGVGLAAPADADTSFTIAITNGPITDVSTAIDFGGTKTSSSVLTDASTDAGGASTTCAGTGEGSSSWSCVSTPGDGFSIGNYSLQVAEQDPDYTVTHTVLAFVIYAFGEAPAVTADTPVVSYRFSPDGVVTTATAVSGGNAAATTITEDLGEGGIQSIGACPAGLNSDHPFGVTPASPTTCTGTIDYDGTAGLARSRQATVTGGSLTASTDESNGVFYVPSNALNQEGSPAISYTSDAAARTVTVVGSVGTSAVTNGEVTDGAVDILDAAGGILCSTTSFSTDPSDPYVDDWSCTTPTLPYGSYDLTAAVEDQGQGSEPYELSAQNVGYGYYVDGGLSSATTVGTVDFPAPPAAAPTIGGVTDITPNWSFTVTGDLTDLHPGDTITVSGSGLPPGTTLDVVLHSTPTDLGTVVAAADGTFTQTDIIPLGVDIGAHTIQVTASGPGLITTMKQQAITVTSPPAAASGSTGKSTVTAPAPTASHGDGSTAGTGLAPNILTRALTPIADVVVHPNKIVSAFEIGLVLLLLAVLPAHLLNATIAEQSDRFERRFGTVHTPGWMARLAVWFRSAPLVGGLVVTLATAILFGFADPKFGFTLASLRLVLACGIALFLVGYVANALTALIARTQWNIVAAVSTRPYGLILTVVGVIISRILHFSPGFLIGLILGLTIQGKSAAGFAWRTVVLRSSIVLLMAIAAWIGYSTLTLGGNEGGTFGSELLVETLVAITTEGVVALLVELLPLRFLEGERVYAHSRVLWGIYYLLTLIVFVLAVVPWEGNWDALGARLWIWILVLAIFAALCVGIYIYYRRFAPPLVEEAGSEKVALGETVAGDRS